jgi:hypothetical protein
MSEEAFVFVVPDQRPWIGGVYTIERFAVHVAEHADVTLAVRSGPLRPLPGVSTVSAPSLRAEELPDADIIVGGLVQPDAERLLELPPSKGVPMFLVQGWGTYNRSPVPTRMRARPRVLATTDLLADEARRHGCPTERVSFGLDRTIFHPGEPCERRPPRVAMMTHPSPAKGMADGLEALAIVRERFPAVEVHLYGEAEPDFPAVFHPGLSGRRDQIAAVLRDAAVVVVPSWQEGFGLTGLEALACGASLATTDTGGSRAYAVHGQTALVTPTRRPDLLAESVLELLRDPVRRGELARRGGEAAAAFPSWPDAAAGLHAAARRLAGVPADAARA